MVSCSINSGPKVLFNTNLLFNMNMQADNSLKNKTQEKKPTWCSWQPNQLVKEHATTTPHLKCKEASIHYCTNTISYFWYLPTPKVKECSSRKLVAKNKNKVAINVEFRHNHAHDLCISFTDLYKMLFINIKHTARVPFNHVTNWRRLIFLENSKEGGTSFLIQV